MPADPSGGGASGSTTPGAGNGTEFAPQTLGGFRLAVKLVEEAITMLKKAWEDLVDAVDQLLKRAQDWLNSDSVWATVVEWCTGEIDDAVVRIRAAMATIGPMVTAILTKMQKAVEGSVPVLPLFEAALDWGTKIDPPLSELAPDMTGSGKIDSWRGPAKLTYEKRVADQIDAVDAVVGKVKATANWLGEVGMGNTEYMGSLAGLMAELANELTRMILNVAVVGGGAITQAAFTLERAVDLIGRAVATEATYTANLGTRLAQVIEQIEKLATEWGDHSGLPGGAWPQSVKA